MGLRCAPASTCPPYLTSYLTQTANNQTKTGSFKYAQTLYASMKPKDTVLVKIKETVLADMPLSIQMQIDTFLENYNNQDEVMTAALKTLQKGPTLKSFMTLYDLSVNIAINNGMTLIEWLTYLSETYTEKELEQLHLLDVIQSEEAKL